MIETDHIEDIRRPKDEGPARSFDALARVYDAARPGYPEEVYEFIEARKSFGSASRILEVGAGPGVATREILDRWNAELIALEPGRRFCALLQEKLQGSTKVRIVNATFEEFMEEGPYDGIFSATAFHWPDPAVKYSKAHHLLADDGLIALYWNNFSVAETALAADIQGIYRKYWPPLEAGYDPITAQRAVIERRKEELESSGYFALAGHAVFERRLRYGRDCYLALLRTFSDHAAREAAMMENFYNEIGRIVDDAGGSIDVRILVNVELGTKRP